MEEKEQEKDVESENQLICTNADGGVSEFNK